MNTKITARSITRRAQRGLTLVETGLALFVGAVALVGGTIAFAKQSSDVKAAQTADGISSIMVGIKDRYGALGSYTGIGNAGVISNTLIPKNFPVSGTTISTPYGTSSTVAVASADSGATFTVTVTGLPTSACSVVLARIDAVSTGIGGGATAPAESTLATAATATTIKAVGSANGLDSSKAMTQCADGGGLVQLIAKAQ
jgi:hypothetical protein